MYPVQAGPLKTSVRALAGFRPASTRSALCHTSRRGSPRAITGVPLLAPGVPVVVIAELLPESWVILGGKCQPSHPLGRLPEVQVRHQQPGRPSVFGRQWLSVILVDDPRLAISEVCDRQICGVTTVA